ncbi:hypothetical protein OROMI_034513 [Orobanche minor]
MSRPLSVGVLLSALWTEHQALRNIDHFAAKTLTIYFWNLITAGYIEHSIDKSVVLWSIHDHISSLAAEGTQKSPGSKGVGANGKPDRPIARLSKLEGFSKGMRILLKTSSLTQQEILRKHLLEELEQTFSPSLFQF